MCSGDWDCVLRKRRETLVLNMSYFCRRDPVAEVQLSVKAKTAEAMLSWIRGPLAELHASFILEKRTEKQKEKIMKELKENLKSSCTVTLSCHSLSWGWLLCLFQGKNNASWLLKAWKLYTRFPRSSPFLVCHATLAHLRNLESSFSLKVISPCLATDGDSPFYEMTPHLPPIGISLFPPLSFSLPFPKWILAWAIFSKNRLFSPLTV